MLCCMEDLVVWPLGNSWSLGDEMAQGKGHGKTDQLRGAGGVPGLWLGVWRPCTQPLLLSTGRVTQEACDSSVSPCSETVISSRGLACCRGEVSGSHCALVPVTAEPNQPGKASLEEAGLREAAVLGGRALPGDQAWHSERGFQSLWVV